jgi:ribose/xylose/arabinose/galactoside ABC-type transport system permease subunit
VAGRGGAVDTVLGVLFVLILRNGLNVMGVPTYYQLAIIGVVLISGIIMSLLVERRLQK